MIIKIPVRVHLLKYLSGKVGAEKIEIQHISQQQMFASESHVIDIQQKLSKTIFPFLNTDQRNQWQMHQLNGKGKYSLVALSFKDYLIDRKRVFISLQGVNKLNDLIDGMMYAELMGIMDYTISAKERHDKAILDFMNKYLIDEDDIKFDSIKKRCYRERLKIQDKIYLNKNLAGMPAILDLSFANKLVQSNLIKNNSVEDYSITNTDTMGLLNQN